MPSKKNTITLVKIATIIAILTSKQKKEHVLAIKELFLSLKMHLILKKCFQPDTKERSDSTSLHECHLMGILWHDCKGMLFEGLCFLRNNYLLSITTALTIVSFNYHMPSHHQKSIRKGGLMNYSRSKLRDLMMLQRITATSLKRCFHIDGWR